MSITEIVVLSAVAGLVAFVWLSLIRASVRGGCRSGSCQAATPDVEDKKDD
jgi:hypothetical protein